MLLLAMTVPLASASHSYTHWIRIDYHGPDGGRADFEQTWDLGHGRDLLVATWHVRPNGLTSFSVSGGSQEPLSLYAEAGGLDDEFHLSAPQPYRNASYAQSQTAMTVAERTGTLVVLSSQEFSFSWQGDVSAMVIEGTSPLVDLRHGSSDVVVATNAAHATSGASEIIDVEDGMVGVVYGGALFTTGEISAKAPNGESYACGAWCSIPLNGGPGRWTIALSGSVGVAQNDPMSVLYADTTPLS